VQDPAEVEEIHAFERNPHRTLFSLSVPVMLSLVVQPLAGVVDTAFVERLGASSSAALGAATTLLAGVLWVFNFLGVGTQTEVSHVMGEGHREATQEVWSLALLVSVGLAVVSALAFWPLVVPAMEWMSNDAATVEQASTYSRILLLGFPASLPILASFGALRGLQDMRTPLWLAAGMTFMNIALDSVLIFGWGPIPAYGIAGAAWATVASQLVTATAAVVVVTRRLGFTWRVRFVHARSFLVVGRDVILRTSALLLFMTLGARAALHISTQAGAAHQALRQMWMLLAFLLDAYASVAQSLIGYFLGAGRSELARRVAGVSVSWGLATGALVAIAMLALEPAVARLLVPADSLVVFGGAWPILALSQPLNAVSFVTDGILFGAKDYAYMRNAMALSTALGISLLVGIDLRAPGALDSVWYVTAFWIALRAGLGWLRIWPGVGEAPLRAATKS
jgi:MATE family multidrug resistance protein